MKNGLSISPKAACREPSTPTTATAPSWEVSTTPERTCSASNWGLVLLAPVAGDDLVLEGIDDLVELTTLAGQLGLHLSQTIDGLDDLVVGELGEIGKDPIVHDLVDQSPTRHRRKRGHDLDMAQRGLGPQDHPLGQDLGQGLEDRPLLVAPATTLLEIEEIHAPMEETAVIRDLRLDVLGCVAATTDLVQLEIAEAFEELRLEDHIEASPLFFHVTQPNNRLRGPWDKG